jgi:hypothetical protein
MSTPMTAKLIAATVAVTTIALTLPASAASLKEIERREQAQADAIKAGRKDGSLTFVESYRLKREQKRIDELEHRALADGKLTKGEMKAIKTAQDDAGRHIYVEKHDQQTRGWFWRHFSR